MAPTGGLLATGSTMLVTYTSGALLDIFDLLGWAWANVTPGQAALLIGLLTYLTNSNRPKLATLARLGRRGRGEG